MSSWKPIAVELDFSRALERMNDDHRELEALFARFSATTSPGARMSLATRICNELKLHAEVEDEIVFPLLRELQFDTRQMALAKFELARARYLISMIESADQFDDYFVAMVTMLGKHMQQHFKAEEQEMFPRLRHGELESSQSHSR